MQLVRGRSGAAAHHSASTISPGSEAFRLPVPGGNRREGNRGDHADRWRTNGRPARLIARKMTVTASVSWQRNRLLGRLPNLRRSSAPIPIGTQRFYVLVRCSEPMSRDWLARFRRRIHRPTQEKAPARRSLFSVARFRRECPRAAFSPPPALSAPFPSGPACESKTP